MSLRDYFAAKAMQGYLARSDWHPVEHTDNYDALISRYAFEMADAMLAARRMR
jgi:hypothetical protein